MDAPYPRFAMVAGESSGDLLAGLLLDGLHQRWSGLSACGIGGPQMTRRGFEAWWPHDKLSVHGYGLDVFLRVGELLAMRRRLKSRLLQRRPDVFIGVDAPDFNLALEASLRTQGVKTVHFVCPSIWACAPSAWRRFAAVPTMCCVCSRSSRLCWRGMASPPPLSAIPWPV